ncbi:hypothetical protein D6764_05820, partial [Candidatus Woesearchaeota archaeon]
DGQEGVVNLYLKPVAHMKSGWKLIELAVRGKKSSQTLREYLKVYIRPSVVMPKTYLPSFSVKLEVPERVDPREEIPVKVILENRNPLNITNMTVRVDSELFSREFTTNLPPLKTKVQTFTVKLDDLLAPTKAKVKAYATTTQNNKEYTVHADAVTFEVAGYSFINKQEVTEKEFLKSREYITLTNDGNVENSAKVRIKTGFFERIFTKTNPKAELKDEEGQKYYEWEFTLVPQETAVIAISKNYRPLALGIVSLIVIVLGYFIFRPPLVAEKKATRVRKGRKDDQETEVKIMILVRNRTGRVVNDITVKDRIPRIAELEKEFEIGTLAPTKITKNDKFGVRLQWKIPSLDPFEERVITYKIKSRLKIVGGIRLPPAVVEFSSGKAVKSIVSNRPVAEM